MRFNQLSVAVAVQAGLVLWAGLPATAGTFGADSDVIGLRLTMSRDEAKAVVASGFPGAPVSELSAVLSTPGFKKAATVGFIANLVTRQDADANQQKAAQQQKNLQGLEAAGFGHSPLNRVVGSVGDFSQDWLKVLFDPNDGSADIFAISRYTEYGRDKQPLTKTTTDALTEKYGPPSRTIKNGLWLRYVWMQPGVSGQTRNGPTKCPEEGDPGQFYEDAEEMSRLGAQFELRTIGEKFSLAVNNVRNKGPLHNYAKCGTVLRISLMLTQNGDYVGSLDERLINLSKAQTELATFGDQFWREAEETRQKKIEGDQNKRPRL